MNSEANSVREPTLKEAALGMLMIILILVITLQIEIVLEVSLVLGVITSALIAVYLGYGWEEIRDGMLEGISNGMIACLILITVGMVVGSWIIGGTIQTLIYYGLQILSPAIFLPAAFFLGGLTSVLIGSSFGTIATMGVVLLGIGEGLGMPTSMVVGAIVSGAVFGDKLSPLSDSTNLASAMSGADLFKHVRSMLWVTLPAAGISLVFYAVLSLGQAGDTMDVDQVREITETLAANYNLSLLTLVPPALVIIMAVMKIPALITLITSFITASVFAIITQGAGIQSLLIAAGPGYTAETGGEVVDGLLTHGGIDMMLNTVAMVIAATAMGGILEKIGVLKTILSGLRDYVQTPRGLVLATLASTYLVTLASAEMYVSIILPGRTFQPAYKEMGLDLSVLSRTLESAATLGNFVLPWGVAALYVQGVLDIGFSYIPYAFLSFIAPIIVIVYAYKNIAMWKKQ